LSPGARRFLAAATKPSALWRLFPDDALLAAAGRFDAAAFEEVLGEFLTPEARTVLRDGLERFIGAALDKDVVKDVLPCLGPDWGLCLTAPASADKTWVPGAVFAVRLRPGDKPPLIDRAVLSAVNTFALLAVLDYNGKHTDRVSLKTEMQDQIEVKYLSNDQRFPPGFRPAFALKDGYLVLASSPEGIRRFGTMTAAAPEGELPLLRVSLKALARYLEAHRRPLTAALAEQKKDKPDETERHLDGVLQVVRLFDRLEVSQRPADGQLTLTLRVWTAQPLKK
jgi:hypothetical protein